MQQNDVITVRLSGLDGRVLGNLTLPASLKLIDLEQALRTLGAARIEAAPRHGQH